MQFTQFAIFEVGNDCNLKKNHVKCPCLERYQATKNKPIMTDEMIIDNAAALYNQHGFAGLVGFHYYNEPMIYIDRIKRLIDGIKAKAKNASFVLWTNGTLLPEDCKSLDIFDKAWLTNYDGGNYERIREGIPNTTFVKWQLDNRKERTDKIDNRRCRRIFSEIIFDAFGECHLCCIDWKGEAKVGNLFDDKLENIVDRFLAVRKSIMNGMDVDAPEICRKCIGRHTNISSLVPEIAQAANKMLSAPQQKQSITPVVSDKISIVCITRNAESVTEEWKQKHTYAESIEYAKNDNEATKAIKDAAKRGSYFGVVLNQHESLDGDVVSAIKLHPNESILNCSIYNAEGSKIGTKQIFRLKDFSKLKSTIPLMRKRISVNMNEIRIISTRQERHNPAVVFVHYKLPDHRLQDHFKWNDTVYRSAGAKVFVVTDCKREVPDYARCLIFTEEMPIFNLAKTSNYGIRAAIESGYQTIIKTDADMVFPVDTWQDCIAVDAASAVVPVYHMATSYALRDVEYVKAINATGTIAMTADNWKDAHFHEGCEGYGSDDAILLRAIEKAGLNINRTPRIKHIAHIEGTPQKEFCKENPRVDHWNRDTGFNPENFQHNRVFSGTGNSENWGLSTMTGAAFVITHYRMPEQRLYDFFKWNDYLFKQYNCRVIVVSDVDHSNLPSYARVAIYPESLDLFCLAKTSNYGIRLAGSGIICKTDPDCVFSEDAIKAVMSVTPEKGVCMRYRMADSYETRDIAEEWEASKGTIALHYDHWQAISGYDERQEGYGIEDGDAYDRAQNKTPGRTVKRSPAAFWHIAHSTEKQTRGNTRPDCWNRESGFNPRNHTHNQRQRQSGKWECEEWGIVI